MINSITPEMHTPKSHILCIQFTEYIQYLGFCKVNGKEIQYTIQYIGNFTVGGAFYRFSSHNQLYLKSLIVSP